MDFLIFYFYEITDSLNISNREITSLINFNDLTAIFLFGVFTSLFCFSYCCYSKKEIKYIIIQPEPINEKTISV
jgi:hypothetical protein